MSGIVRQTLAGVAQFTGLAAAGLFTFSEYNRIPRTSRVVLTILSYTEIPAGPALTTNVQFWAFRPGGTPTEKVALGDATAAGDLLDANGEARLRLCGIPLPREPGDAGAFWEVRAFTQNKSDDATVCVDFVLSPFPDTSERDSNET